MPLATQEPEFEKQKPAIEIHWETHEDEKHRDHIAYYENTVIVYGKMFPRSADGSFIEYPTGKKY